MRVPALGFAMLLAAAAVQAAGINQAAGGASYGGHLTNWLAKHLDTP